MVDLPDKFPYPGKLNSSPGSPLLTEKQKEMEGTYYKERAGLEKELAELGMNIAEQLATLLSLKAQKAKVKNWRNRLVFNFENDSAPENAPPPIEE